MKQERGFFFITSNLQVEWCDPLKVTKSAMPFSDFWVLNAFKAFGLAGSGTHCPPPVPEGGEGERVSRC